MILGADDVVGETMVADRRYPLISATGSTRMGRRVGTVVAERLGRSLLELGGNNAIVVLEDANLELSLRAIAFAAAGTSGQRCTTCRRLFVQRGIADQLAERIASAFSSMTIGDPMDADTLVGVSVDESVAGAAEIHEMVMAEMEGDMSDDMDESMSDDMDESMDDMDDESGSDMEMSGDHSDGEMPMMMQEMDSGLPLPAGETVSLEPGSYHVMLLELVEPLETGDEFEVTLTFAEGDDMTIEVPVLETAP